MHFFANAAGPVEEESTGHEEPTSTSQQDLIQQALSARSNIMFSGESGAAVASGIKDDAATAEEPTYGLVKAALFVVFSLLPDSLFDQFAEQRPCGVLDRYEAVGMLIGDALGLPLMLARPHGLKVGREAQKKNKEIAPETERVKKALKRRGESPSLALPAVLRQVVRLPLPSAAECVAAPVPAPDSSSLLIFAPLPPPTPMSEYSDDITPPPPPSNLPASTPPPVPAPSPPPMPESSAPSAPALEPETALPCAAKKPLRLKGSRLAEDAIHAAHRCELKQTWLREDEDEPVGVREGWEAYDAEMRERGQEIHWDLYLDSLLAMKERFPMMVCCHYFEIGGCVHGKPCECGGLQAPWPWIVHHPWASNFCECGQCNGDGTKGCTQPFASKPSDALGCAN